MSRMEATVMVPPRIIGTGRASAATRSTNQRPMPHRSPCVCLTSGPPKSARSTGRAARQDGKRSHAKRILRPVRALNEAAGRLQHGDLSVRIQDTSGDELGQLGLAFNAMAISMAASQEQLEEKVRTLGMPEVDYFLEHFGGSFERTLDELQE